MKTFRRNTLIILAVLLLAVGGVFGLLWLKKKEIGSSLASRYLSNQLGIEALVNITQLSSSQVRFDLKIPSFGVAIPNNLIRYNIHTLISPHPSLSFKQEKFSLNYKNTAIEDGYLDLNIVVGKQIKAAIKVKSIKLSNKMVINDLEFTPRNDSICNQNQCAGNLTFNLHQKLDVATYLEFKKDLYIDKTIYLISTYGLPTKIHFQDRKAFSALPEKLEFQMQSEVLVKDSPSENEAAYQLNKLNLQLQPLNNPYYAVPYNSKIEIEHADRNKESKKFKNPYSIKIKIADNEKKQIAAASGFYDQDSSNLELNYEVNLDFKNQGLQPDQLFPITKDLLKKTQGSLVGSGRVEYKEASTIVSLTAKTTGLDLEVKGLPLTKLETEIWLSSVAPLQSNSKHVLTISEIGSKESSEAAVKNFKTVFDFNKNSKINISTSNAHWLGGNISIQPFVFDYEKLNFKTNIKIEDIDIEQISKILNNKNIQGKGKLSGDVPIYMEKGFVGIDNGHLTNSGVKGIIQYRNDISGSPQKIVYLDEFQKLLAQGEQALVFKALDNFHFKKIVIRINRSLKEKLSAGIQLEGKNPDLGKGMPFEFGINVGGDLEKSISDSLFKSFVNDEKLEHYNR